MYEALYPFEVSICSCQICLRPLFSLFFIILVCINFPNSVHCNSADKLEFHILESFWWIFAFSMVMELL